LALLSPFSVSSGKASPLGPLRAPGPFRCVRCTYLLRKFSDVVTVRHSGAGSYRRMYILDVSDDMFRLCTYTRTVFEHVFYMQKKR